jgi:hypothetical protein
MTTTVQEKPIYNCTSCNGSLDNTSHIMADKKHYCGKCFKLYDTPFLPPLINFVAYILLIGSIFLVIVFWPEGYSFQLTALDYIPAIASGFSGFIAFLLLLATSKALSYLREITKGTIKQSSKETLWQKEQKLKAKGESLGDKIRRERLQDK